MALARDGGTPVREDAFPPRHLFGAEETETATRLFREADETGIEIGYSGEEELGYEREFSAFMGGGYADMVNSGTSAVYVALGALKLPAGSEVIVPPITDPGGMMPVALLMLVPVIADASPHSFNMGAAEIEAVITERTRAIIVAHIAGNPADMDAILAVAAKHNLPVLEDCAQAHAASYKGSLVGSLGTIAAFSTMSGKHHATAAQGGVVFSKDKLLIEEAKRFSDRGKPFFLDEKRGANDAAARYGSDSRARNLGNVRAGLNLNGSDLAGAIGRVQLRKLPATVEARRAVVASLAKEIGTQAFPTDTPSKLAIYP
jgi:perosamine synthetase